MNSDRLIKIPEPAIEFGYNQSTFDPRDGLTLFGPYSQGKINEIHVGLIGTTEGVIRGGRWLDRIKSPIYCHEKPVSRPFFPGFTAAFGATINYESTVPIIIDKSKIMNCLRYENTHVRIYNMCELFLEKLIRYKNEEDFQPNIWLIVLPQEILLHGKPKSGPAQDGDTIKYGFKSDYSKYQPKLYAPLTEDQEPYKYATDFHHQIKVRFLSLGIVSQIALETKIAFREFGKTKSGRYKYDYEKQESSIAWNMSTAIYYKAGGIPWKLREVRDGVCYVGLVFKKIENYYKENWACCAAQMFLDSGDGMVFRGNNGPWIKTNPYGGSSFHLSKESAADLLIKSLDAFKEKNGRFPKEVFIHSRTYFDENEWNGFKAASENKTEIYGVRIREDYNFKLYREYDYPVLRGIAVSKGAYSAYLFTGGYIPRLRTQAGREVPNPLEIRIIRGKCDLELVCRDVLMLTKLNYNSCIFGDSKPVTLKFADKVGEILTATEAIDGSIKTFKYYI